MSRNIWIDDETRRMEKQILDKNPKFNFSQLYKLAIFRETNSEPKKDLSYKKNKLLELKNDRAHVDADIKILMEEIKQMEEDYRLSAEEMTKEEEKQYENKIFKLAGYYMDKFEIKDYDAAKSLAMEFDEQIRTEGVGFMDFAKKKGYKPKKWVEKNHNS